MPVNSEDFCFALLVSSLTLCVLSLIHLQDMHLSALESLYATFRNKKKDPDSIDDDEITRVQSELEGNDIVAAVEDIVRKGFEE